MPKTPTKDRSPSGCEPPAHPPPADPRTNPAGSPAAGTPPPGFAGIPEEGAYPDVSFDHILSSRFDQQYRGTFAGRTGAVDPGSSPPAGVGAASTNGVNTVLGAASTHGALAADGAIGTIEYPACFSAISGAGAAAVPGSYAAGPAMSPNAGQYTCRSEAQALTAAAGVTAAFPHYPGVDRLSDHDQFADAPYTSGTFSSDPYSDEYAFGDVGLPHGFSAPRVGAGSNQNSFPQPKRFHHPGSGASPNKGFPGKGYGKGQQGRQQQQPSRAMADSQWRARDPAPVAMSPASATNEPNKPAMHLTLEELHKPDPNLADRIRAMAGTPGPLFAFRIQKLVLRQFFRSLNKVAEVEAVRHGSMLHDGIFLVSRWDDVDDVISFCRSIQRSRHSVKARLRVLPTENVERILSHETRDRLFTTLGIIHNSPQDRQRMMQLIHAKVLDEERTLLIPAELARPGQAPASAHTALYHQQYRSSGEYYEVTSSGEYYTPSMPSVSDRERQWRESQSTIRPGSGTSHSHFSGGSAASRPGIGTGQSNLSAGSWRGPPPASVGAKGVYAVYEGKPSSSSSNSRPSSGLHSNRSRPGTAEHPFAAAGLAAAPTGTAPTGGKGGGGDPPGGKGGWH